MIKVHNKYKSSVMASMRVKRSSVSRWGIFKMKKKLNKDGQMKELKLRQYYQKPSEIKREKKKEGIRRFKKEQKIKALKGEL